MNCVCGHSADEHEDPGGPCANCWHCDWYQAPGSLNSHDLEALDRIEPGAGDWWRDNQRRWW